MGADPLPVPRMMYGTAWKEDQTERLVGLALEAGFRAIDTANQRKHYFEAGVGAALGKAFTAGLVDRDDLFLQTKFTHLDGQDHRLPYDPKAPVATQVQQSLESSLGHLGIERLDALLLHGPSVPEGLADDDREAWTAMEDLQRDGQVRLLGVSNVSADQLEELLVTSRVKPAIVQNRCFTRPHRDRAVRNLCARHGLAYEGFSLLTGHRTLLGDADVHAIARRLGATIPQVVFHWCLSQGMVVLTGTTSAQHMAQDLAAPHLPLTAADMASVGRAVG
jgi:diketogulonate reductase-like aldo/keto reductase